MPETIEQASQTLINKMLGRIGAGEIFALDEDTELAGQVVPIYQDLIETLIGEHDWHFARRTFKLDQVAEIAANGYSTTDKKFTNGWRHAFAMPGTRLSSPRRVLTDPRNPDNPLRTFAIEEATIYADRKPLWAVFTISADPSVWPPLFKQMVIAAGAARFAVPVAHDSKLAAELHVEAYGTPEMERRGGLRGAALAADAAGGPVRAPIWYDPLTQAHMS
jgi:hypothetical protein